MKKEVLMTKAEFKERIKHLHDEITKAGGHKTDEGRQLLRDEVNLKAYYKNIHGEEKLIKTLIGN